MKLFRIIFATLLVVISCNDVGNIQGEGENPLDKCVLPSVAQAGEEVLVQWNGFTGDARIWLVSEDGTEHEMSIEVLTDSGIMFVVPADLPAGTYVFMLDQSGHKELGTIEVLAADMPVTGLKVPSNAFSGEELVIEGIGFEDGCSVMLVDADGNEHAVDARLIISGISVVLPDDVPKGDYSLYIVQNGAKWLISDSFTVYVRGQVKSLVRLDYYSPYLNSSELKLSWEINREDPVTLTLSEFLVEGEEETLQAYDRYVCDADGTFILEHDGFESSNDMEVSYTRDEDGTVTLADVLIYGKSKTTAFAWTYDADGYLTEIASATNSFRSLDYTSGNLTSFRNTDFIYNDLQLMNHPSAPDVAWAYMAMMETNDPFVYFPYLLGWYGKASVNLPDVLRVPSPMGSGKEDHPLKYTFDEDGYVVRMEWDSSFIEFEY